MKNLIRIVKDILHRSMIGKSRVIKRAARKLGMKCEDISCRYVDPENFHGLPEIGEK